MWVGDEMKANQRHKVEEHKCETCKKIFLRMIKAKSNQKNHVGARGFGYKTLRSK